VSTVVTGVMDPPSAGNRPIAAMPTPFAAFVDGSRIVLSRLHVPPAVTNVSVSVCAGPPSSAIFLSAASA
jgi:hypothetical protein